MGRVADADRRSARAYRHQNRRRHALSLLRLTRRVPIAAHDRHGEAADLLHAARRAKTKVNELELLLTVTAGDSILWPAGTLFFRRRNPPPLRLTLLPRNRRVPPLAQAWCVGVVEDFAAAGGKNVNLMLSVDKYRIMQYNKTQIQPCVSHTV